MDKQQEDMKWGFRELRKEVEDKIISNQRRNKKNKGQIVSQERRDVSKRWVSKREGKNKFKKIKS